MLHDITEFEIRDGLQASYDLKTGGKNIIFRICKVSDKAWTPLAVANISEHECLGVQECYTEATIMNGDTTVEDFRVLYEALKYHIAWYRKKPNGALIPYIISNTYFKNKYGTKKRLMEVSKKLKRVK